MDAENMMASQISKLKDTITNLTKDNEQLQNNLQVALINLNDHLSVSVVNVDTDQMETMLPPTFVTLQTRKRKRVPVEKIVNNINKNVKIKIEKVNTLLDDSKQATKAAEEKASKAVDDLEDALECVVCYERKRDTLYTPCGHFNTCGVCASMNSLCPTCRTPINSRLKVFFS
jgi:hypothetical protein